MVKENIKLAPPNKVYGVQDSVQVASDYLLSEIDIVDNLGELDFHYAQAIANLLQAKDKLDSLLSYVTGNYKIIQEEYIK